MLTEYLRFRLIPDTEIDGIIFPSSVPGKQNVVMFYGPTACLTDEQIKEGDERIEVQALNYRGTHAVVAYGAPPVRAVGP